MLKIGSAQSGSFFIVDIRVITQPSKLHEAGWPLVCDLSKVTLRDVYTALGCPSLLAMGNRTESPDCLVEAAVNAQLSKSFRDAEELLLASFGAVTLATLSDDVRARLAKRRRASFDTSVAINS
jgi:hypothetical protein